MPQPLRAGEVRGDLRLGDPNQREAAVGLGDPLKKPSVCFEHLAPQVVDAAVALVGDDEVEGLDRQRRVVRHLLRPAVGGELEGRMIVQFVGQLGLRRAASNTCAGSCRR